MTLYIVVEKEGINDSEKVCIKEITGSEEQANLAASKVQGPGTRTRVFRCELSENELIKLDDTVHPDGIHIADFWVHHPYDIMDSDW